MYPNSIYFVPHVHVYIYIHGNTWRPKYILFGYMDPYREWYLRNSRRPCHLRGCRRLPGKDAGLGLVVKELRGIIGVLIIRIWVVVKIMVPFGVP